MAFVNSIFNSSMAVGISRLDQTVSASIRKLATGIRLQQAGDDPAGFALLKNVQKDLSGTAQATVNAVSTKAMLQTADVGIETVRTRLLEMRTLALRASGDQTLSDSQRATLNSSFAQMRQDITNIASGLKFGDKYLLDGSMTGASVMIAPPGGTIFVSIPNLAANVIADGTGALVAANATLSSTTNAAAALSAIDTSLDYINSVQVSVGVQERAISSIMNSLSADEISLSYSKSLLGDTDMAQEITSLTKAKLMSDVSVAMLTQAKKLNKSVLSYVNQK